MNTRVPAGGLRGDASTYVGSFAGNGQTIDASQNIGKLGWFVSGTRQATDMRREPVMFDTLTGDPINFHNHGEDLYTFGKLQYLPTTNDVVNLDLNWSRTRFEVPYDSTGGSVQRRSPAGHQQLRQPGVAAPVSRAAAAAADQSCSWRRFIGGAAWPTPRA